MADTSVKTQFSGRTWGGIIQGPGGELLCTAHYIREADALRAAQEAKPGEKPLRRNRDVLLRSTDGGRNWSEYSTIAADPMGERPAWMGSEGPGESSVQFLPDGRLYAVYRTGGNDGMIGNSWSSDGGKTWTAPATIGFHGVAPARSSTRKGVLVLVTGRPGPVDIRFNVDGVGKVWSRPVTLFTGTSTHYTDVAEIQPGHLLVVYDSLPYGWYEIPFADRDARNTIFGTFVGIERE